jgi:acetyl esterase
MLGSRVVALRDRIDGGLSVLGAKLPDRVQLLLAGREPVRIDGQELDPGVQLAIRALAMQGMRSVSGAAPGVPDPDPVAVRADYRRRSSAPHWRPTPVGAVRDLEVDGAAGRLPARHYAPPEAGERSGPCPLLVFLHGGGMVIGDLDTHDEACRLLCRHAGIQVLAIDYRLAPENPFPASVEDALAAFRWGAANAASLAADPERVAVGGDSAGGNLSAVVSQLATHDGGPAPALQVLVYPKLDFVNDYRSTELFDQGFILTGDDRRWFDTHYFGATGADPADPRLSPALADDLGGLPPAVIVSAAFDPLRDEGEQYADRLREAGVRVVKHRAAGMTHGFIQMTVLRGPRDATVELAGMVRAALARPRIAPL